MTAKHGLGRGLGALLQDGTPPTPSRTETAPAGQSVQMIRVADLARNAFQPRHRFDEDTLAELTQSVREHGILQPLLVRRQGDGFQLIAGERRLRAALAADLKEAPALVMEAEDVDALELALIENLQREDLNPMDEAEGYRQLMDRFGLTQEQVATRMGKARATVANALRLLALPAELGNLVRDRDISPGHAKVLSALDIEKEQILLGRRVVKEQLSVRQLESIVRRWQRAPRKPRATRQDIPDTHLTYLSDRLHDHFATGIRIRPCRTLANGKKAGGCIEIDFYSTDDLDRILELLGMTEEP